MAEFPLRALSKAPRPPRESDPYPKMQAPRSQPLTANRLPGCVVKTYATYKGKRLGPYYVRSWKENGKQRKQYIKPADLFKVREAIENQRIHKAKAKEIREVFTLLTANLNFLHTMARRSAKQVLESEQYTYLAHLENDLLTPNRPPLRRPRQAKSSIPRSIVLPGDVWRSVHQKATKKSALHPSSFRPHPSPKGPFMYPFFTNSSPMPQDHKSESDNPKSQIQNPKSSHPVPQASKPVRQSPPLAKEDRHSKIDNDPNPNLPPHATPDYLAARFADLPQGGYELSHTSAKDLQASFPKPKKITHYFFIDQEDGKPEREVNDVQVWIKGPEGEPDQDTGQIYQYFSEPISPNDPGLTPETTWINPNYNPTPNLTTRPIFKKPW